MLKAPAEFINGVVRQWLYSPKGAVEGVLLSVKGKAVQITTTPAEGAGLARGSGVGKRLRVLATADRSAKAAQGDHPVHAFHQLADAAGQPLASPVTDPLHSQVKGVVAALHYARHGQPNGVLLANGEFIHLRPHGMAMAGLGIGAKVLAVGALKTTVLGTPMLEASSVNRMAID